MIYTLTLNPSLDYMTEVEELKIGGLNRTGSEKINAGGKGINVSLVLKNLEVESTALGFLAGFTGEEIRHRLNDAGIYSDFISLAEGFSRINIKIRGEKETEINGRGPLVSEIAKRQLLSKIEELKDGDIIVLAGSIPASMDKHIYRILLETIKEKNIYAIVDAEKETLLETLSYHPFLIKPNHHELGEIFDVEIGSRKEAVQYAEKLQKMGALNVLISMASDGAVLLAENGNVFEADATPQKAVNSVGAGDSMVAGFLKGYLETEDLEKALYWGLAAGSASACGEDFADLHTVKKILAEYYGIR